MKGGSVAKVIRTAPFHGLGLLLAERLRLVRSLASGAKADHRAMTTDGLKKHEFTCGPG